MKSKRTWWERGEKGQGERVGKNQTKDPSTPKGGIDGGGATKDRRVPHDRKSIPAYKYLPERQGVQARGMDPKKA